jgi:sulfur-carrier protein
MASVRLDHMLREFTPKLTLASDAGNVQGVLVDLETRFPRLKFRLRDETGRQRRFVRIFVNGEDVAALKGMETPVGPADHIDILHSIQGG